METREYRTVDKSGWPRGEWTDEPDKMQWQDEETGLPCLLVRGPSGALCGYVGVSEGHPLYEVDYDRVYDKADVRVHGGLTFSDRCQPTGDESKGICHVPGEGEPDHVWWLGFDCAHLGDVMPAHDRSYGYDSWYKDVGYVRQECASLARQIAAVAE